MATADERRESRKKTGQANQAAGKYKSVTPSKAPASPRPKPRPTTIDWSANKDKTDARTYTRPASNTAPPAPKAKAVVPRNNTANVIAGRQARGLSMLEAQNQRRNRQGKVVSAADASYGYIGADGKFVMRMMRQTVVVPVVLAQSFRQNAKL
jgi:hypothetical protein